MLQKRLRSYIFRLTLCLSSSLLALPARAQSNPATPGTKAHSDYNAGLQHQQAGELQQAEAAYLRALRQTPELMPARYNLGLLYFEQQRLEAARQQVAAALQHWLADADLHALAGSIAQASAQPAEAQSAWRRACQLAPEHASCAWLQPLAEAPPPPAEALQALRQGEALQHGGQLTAAASKLREAARLAPGWASPAHVLGTVLQQAGQPEAARLAWQEALRRDPGHIGARVQLAERAQQQGQYTVALLHWYQALSHRPRFTRGYAELAALAQQQGQHAAALRWRQQLHQLAPDWPGNRQQLASLYYEQGQLHTARALLQGLPATDPAQQALLARILLAQGEAEAGLLQLQEALKRWPTHTELQLALASAYLSQNQPAQARHSLSLALSQAQPPAEAYALRGQLALQEADLQRGLAWLQRAVQLQPSAAHYEWLIFGQLKAGQPAAAADTLQLALKAHPGHPALASLAQSLSPGRFSRKGRY